jgi:hypothetical protein
MSARVWRNTRAHLRVGIGRRWRVSKSQIFRSYVPPRLSRASVLLCAALLVSSHPAVADFVQQGSKLVGTGAVGAAQQGNAVAVSADGNTAIMGGPEDNGAGGAAWVFTRSGGVWSQQGSKLFGTGASGNARQGRSVALSANGDTAIVGGPFDGASDIGAAWVFTRSGGVWTQQGSKLVGTGVPLGAAQGTSVALSADGNTAIVGGPLDNGATGAAWVFTRSGGVWTQQGSKLVGTGSVTGDVGQGGSVALSADGNTAMLGGQSDNLATGAVWVFTRNGGVWTQQGSKLVGTGAVGAAAQGSSVALSADGNTAIVGGQSDNGGFDGIGASWVFTRNGGVWTQQGGKLVGTGSVGGARQGSSVALTDNGNTAMVGGRRDNGDIGAVWVFTRSGGVWTQQGSKLVGTGGVGNAEQGGSVALSSDGCKIAVVGGKRDNSNAGAAWVFVQPRLATATHDFNGDRKSDILWRESGGTLAAWFMNGSQIAQAGSYGVVPNNWQLVGQRDFDGNCKTDLLWRDGTSGRLAIWLLNGLQVQAGNLATVPNEWQTVGTADFNGDDRGDILWRHSTSGTVAIWFMNGLQVANSAVVGSVGLEWTIVGVGDFNGDGRADILWRNNEGTVAIWLMNGLQILDTGKVAEVSTDWTIVGTGDFNGDGNVDILWRHTNGTMAIWLVSGFQAVGLVIGSISKEWTVVETGDFNGDGKSDILWREGPSGTVAIWFMNGPQITSGVALAAVANTWTIQELNSD